MQREKEQLFTEEDFHEQTIVIDSIQLEVLKYICKNDTILEQINPNERRNILSDSNPFLETLSEPEPYEEFEIDLSDF